jgi:hypothetical protein
MTDDALRAELIQFFNDTQRAHHHAYRATHGADVEWPIWYAEFMQVRLNGMIHAVCTRSELVYLLVMVERERASQASEAPWAETYADFFLKRYGPMQGQMPSEPAGPDASPNEEQPSP